MTLPESQVPDELWEEVLENVCEYDRPTLESFSLTCRAFCGISRPRLFSKIYFTPYFTDQGPVLLPSPTEVERRIERLDFLSSTGIAALVQQCHISPHTSYGYREIWSFSTDAPYILLDALFERLPRFTGLQQLTLFRISLTHARVDILFRLPKLSKLHISWCSITPKDHVQLFPQGLQLSEFHLCHDAKLEDAEDYWIPLLHAECLRLLTMSFTGRAVGTIPIFPNVHTLRAIIGDTLPSHPQNLTMMSKFPGVRILIMAGKEFATGPASVQCEAVFPHLEEYHGHCQALLLFLAASTLTRIQTKCARPQDLLTHISGIQCHKITSFKVTFETLSSLSFNEMVKLFPQLTELLLTITVSDTSRLFKREIYDPEELAKDEVVDGRYGDSVRSGFTVSTFFLKLSNAPFLPSGLERLAISWQCHEQFLDELSAYKLPGFPQIRDALVARCPGLTRLWFNGIYFMYEWRDPMPDGKVKEYIGKNYMDAYREHETADIFYGWEVIW
ncbi:hypothetical protein C8R45DRAFT_1216185 [Mycena sanguinolenta]|nr:hypothetical protein C8R45DRAFT_1216185 [Mycena sanguinolenta]